MICKHILLMTFFNKSKLIFLYTVKWFQDCYIIQIILYTINHCLHIGILGTI